MLPYTEIEVGLSRQGDYNIVTKKEKNIQLTYVLSIIK